MMFKDCATLLLILAASASVGLVQTARHPEQVYTDGFLFHDPGVNLLLAEELAAGKVLYRDLGYPYGPAPIYLYAVAARIFGNSAVTYVEFHRILALLHVALIYLVLRSHFPRLPSAAVTLLGAVPFATVPGAVLGGYLSSSYLPVERCWLTLLPLLWRPPGDRSASRTAALGVYLGGYQFVKFGGCFFAGAAVLLLDLIALVIGGSGRDRLGRWVRTGLVAVSAFAAVESARWAITFAALPAPVAWDVAWPAYTGRLYDTIAHDPYPWQLPWKHVLLRQLMPILGAVYSVAGLVLAARRGAEAVPRLGIVTLALFYAAGSLKYFGHVHVFWQYAWMLVIPVVLLCHLVSPVARPVILASLLPGWLALTYLLILPPPGPDRPRYAMPNGDVLFPAARDDPPMLDLLESVFRRRWGEPQPGPSRPILIVPVGAGYHFYYRVPRVSRNLWYIPHYVRTYDTPDLLRSLDWAAAVVVMAGLSRDPLDWAGRVFAPEVVTIMRERLEPPVQVTPDCRVFFFHPAAPPRGGVDGASRPASPGVPLAAAGPER